MDPAAQRTHEMTEIALVVALSIALGNLRLLELPNGGSISFASAPLVMLALVRGFRPALVAGLLAGVGHALFGGRVIHPAQFLLDYGAGYSVLALAALGRWRETAGQVAAVMLAGAAQLACFTASGAIFFAATVTAENAWAYSLAYNATHVVPEITLTAAVTPLLVRSFRRAVAS